MNDLEFATFQTAVDVTYHFQREWRYGQTVMNVLAFLRKDLYNQVWATQLDCFQRDDLSGPLMNWLRTGVPETLTRQFP